MKLVIFGFCCLLSVCGAVEPDAELIQPQQQTNGAANAQPITTERGNKENLEARSERLRQPSETSLRQPHVYLPDGRLQPVEYITSPVIPPPSQYQLIPERVEGLNVKQAARPALVKYIEFSEEGFQPYVTAEPPLSLLLQQPRSQRYQEVVNNVQYYERPADMGVEYLQFPAVTPDQLSPYRISEAVQERKVVSKSESPKQEIIRQEGARGSMAYLPASLRYSEVQHLAAPVYTYAPQPLVRILSYAPQGI